MLTSCSTRTRRGVTLVELLVTMVVGGVALALTAAVCLRQQRIFSDLAQSTAVAGQLREGASILPIDLRGVASRLGDIREARDTAIELRATIASAVVCDTTGSRMVVAPRGAAGYAGMATSIEPGDSAWLLVAGDSTEDWRPYRVVASAAASGGQCAALGPRLDAVSRITTRQTLVVDSAPLASWIGSPVRVTRRLRYSLYRSSDGSWHLGQRDWNATLQRFNTIQPVSGPYLSAPAGGLVFRYYDSASAALPVPVPDPRAIALIHFDLRGQPKVAPRAVASAAPGPRIDSASMWLLVRNRR